MTELDTKTMYQALINKDSQFEVIFFLTVKSTGIFCRPTCSARKPKIENTEYYKSIKDALDHGYRPCKVCRPLHIKDQIPEYIQKLIAEINKNPGIKISDFELRKRNIEPNSIRRWFNKNYGITFQAYQRSIRINRAFGTVRHGEKITNVAYDQGFESLSGFGYSFKKA